MKNFIRKKEVSKAKERQEKKGNVMTMLENQKIINEGR